MHGTRREGGACLSRLPATGATLVPGAYGSVETARSMSWMSGVG